MDKQYDQVELNKELRYLKFMIRVVKNRVCRLEGQLFEMSEKAGDSSEPVTSREPMFHLYDPSDPEQVKQEEENRKKYLPQLKSTLSQAMRDVLEESREKEQDDNHD